jgi:hypothetical protein
MAISGVESHWSYPPVRCGYRAAQRPIGSIEADTGEASARRPRIHAGVSALHTHHAIVAGGGVVVPPARAVARTSSEGPRGRQDRDVPGR